MKPNLYLSEVKEQGEETEKGLKGFFIHLIYFNVNNELW